MSSQQELIKLNEVIAECTRLLSDQVKGWQNIVKEINNVNKSAPSSYIKMQREASKAILDLEKQEQEYQKTLQQKQRLEKQMLVTERQRVQLSETVRKATENQTKAIERQIQAENKSNAALERSKNTYNMVEQRIKVLTQTYNNLAAKKELGMKLNDSETAQLNSLQGRLNQYNEVLKKVDAQIGKNQRNVGNYASGWNGLGNSINQITRELPAFTFSAQTGFLALSNNIPILADEIKRVSDNVAEMRAKGQQVPGVMSQILTSFLSWQTALSIGVTLITVYGKEIGNFISELFEGSKKIDVAKISLESYNEALKGGDYQKAYTDVQKVGIAFEQARNGTLSKKEALETYNNTLGDVMGKTNDFNKAESIYTSNADKYIAATLAKASANYLFAKSAELNAQRVELLNKTDFTWWEKRQAELKNLFNGQSKYSAQAIAEMQSVKDATKLEEEIKANEEAIKGFFTEYEKNAKGLNLGNFFGGDGKDGTKANEQAINSIKDLINAEYELNKVRLERQRDEAKFAQDNETIFLREYDLEKLSYDKKVALAKLEIQDKQLLNLELERLREENLNNIEEIGRNELVAEEQIAKDIVEAITKYNELKKKAREEAEKDRQERVKNEVNLQALDNQIGIESLGGNRGSKYWDLQEKDLEDWYKNQQELHKNNADELLRIDKEYTLSSIKLNNDRKNAFKQAMTEMYSSALGEMGAGSLAQFFNGQFEEIWAGADTLQEKMAAVMQAIGQIATDVFNAMSERQNAYYEKQFKNLETEKDLAIKFAGDNTAGREAIERQYEEKKRALQMEQAKQQKKMAIAQAGINIAMGITAALSQVPPYSFILAGLVGVLGAIQIANIQSTPLPQFWMGTDNAPEGFALTQEKGAEMITDKNGKIKTIGNNKGAQLTYLNKGDKVFTADETTQKLNELLIGSGVAPIVNTEVNNGLSKADLEDVMKRTLGSQPRNSITLDEGGFKSYQEKQNKRTILKNRNVKI